MCVSSAADLLPPVPLPGFLAKNKTIRTIADPAGAAIRSATRSDKSETRPAQQEETMLGEQPQRRRSGGSLLYG